jgi:hypothetical protein
MTPMVAKNFEDDPGLREIWERENMLGRISDPSEYRGAALFLLSDASSFMTGSQVSDTHGCERVLTALAHHRRRIYCMVATAILDVFPIYSLAFCAGAIRKLILGKCSLKLPLPSGTTDSITTSFTPIETSFP